MYESFSLDLCYFCCLDVKDVSICLFLSQCSVVLIFILKNVCTILAEMNLHIDDSTYFFIVVVVSILNNLCFLFLEMVYILFIQVVNVRTAFVGPPGVYNSIMVKQNV